MKTYPNPIQPVTNEDLLDFAQGYLESTNYGIIPEGKFTRQQTAHIPYPAEMDLSEIKRSFP